MDNYERELKRLEEEISKLSAETTALEEENSELNAEGIKLCWDLAKNIAEKPNAADRETSIKDFVIAVKDFGFPDVDMEFMLELANKFAAEPDPKRRTNLIGRLFEKFMP